MKQSRYAVRKIATATVIVLGSALLLIQPTGAQNNEQAAQSSRNNSAQLSQNDLEQTDNKQTRTNSGQEKRCQIIKTKLEEHLEKIEQRAENRQQRYQTIITKLNTLALRLENNEVQADGLRVAIALLSERVSDFNTSYQAYVVALQDAANTACSGDSQLRPAIGEARSNVAKARSGAAAIRTFIQEELKPLLENLKQTNDSTEPSTQQDIQGEN